MTLHGVTQYFINQLIIRLFSSDEVRVLHRHVEALLDHRVVRVDVGAGPNNRLRSLLVVNTRVTLRSESLLARVEDHAGVLKLLLGPWLAHRLWPLRILRSRVLIQARPWHLQLETLPVEDLVVVEARRGSIEAHTLARNRLVITRPRPIALPHVLILLHASHLIFDAKNGVFIIHVLALFTLRHDLRAFATLALQNANAGIVPLEGHVEAVARRSENGVAHGTLLRKCCVHATHRVALLATASTLSSYRQIHCRLRHEGLNIVRSRPGVLIANVQPAVFHSCRV